MSDSPAIEIEDLAGDVVSDPQTLDRMERGLRRDLWGIAVPDAVAEHRIEVREYGPIEAMLVVGHAEEPRVNLILGAAEPLAVERGHLADASKALKGLGVDHYIPVTSGREDSAAAEAWLEANGYRPRHRRARFLRDAAPPGLAEPPAIEVDELTDYETEGEYFSYLIVWAYELGLSLTTLFFELPGKPGWRCYAAIDDEEAAVGCAAMRIDEGIALLALDATHEGARGRGSQLALLRRRLLDAAAAGCHTLMADTEEPLDVTSGSSPAARNLQRAGFARVSTSTVWGP